MKSIIIILFSILIVSCDPGYEEDILIVNKTNITLPVKIIQSENSRFHDFKYDNQNIVFTTSTSDSIIIVKFDLVPGGMFYLWHAGGIGQISLKTRKAGEVRFNEICDSICIENYSLKKNIKDFDNWNFYLDPDYEMGGKVEYTFSITDDMLN